MNAIKTTIQNRRIELPAPDDLPDGTAVLVELTPINPTKVGIDESEWRDDPASLADWEAWIKTIEPLEYSPEEAARMAEFDEAVRRYNIEAVRRQMENGPGA
jgi:hypothetical protein